MSGGQDWAAEQIESTGEKLTIDERGCFSQFRWKFIIRSHAK